MDLQELRFEGMDWIGVFEG